LGAGCAGPQRVGYRPCTGYDAAVTVGVSLAALVSLLIVYVPVNVSNSAPVIGHDPVAALVDVILIVASLIVRIEVEFV
jgi:hypothetical protein